MASSTNLAYSHPIPSVQLFYLTVLPPQSKSPNNIFQSHHEPLRSGAAKARARVYNSQRRSWQRRRASRTTNSSSRHDSTSIPWCWAPGQQQGPPQPPLQMSNPKTRPPPKPAAGIVDLRHHRSKDPEVSYEELMTYEVLTLRKADPTSDNRALSWERALHVNECVPHNKAIKQIQYLILE